MAAAHDLVPAGSDSDGAIDVDVEPPHIHVVSVSGHGTGTAKLLLSPVRMLRSRGLSARELRRIGRFVVEHEHEFVRAWNEYFSAD
jgi:hypothetical protein